MNLKTFCSFRWSDSLVNLERGEVRSCCKTPPFVPTEDQLIREGLEIFDNSSYIQERRREMLLGHQHSDCSFCWKLEAEQLPHPRQKSHSLDSLFSVPLQESSLPHRPEAFLKTPQVDHLEILLKNTCQMKCLYCSALYSSAWEREDLQQGKPAVSRPRIDFQEKFQDLFWQSLPGRLKSVSEINVIGGEPLIQNEFYDLVEKVYDLKKNSPHPRLRLSVVSNLSLSLTTMERWMKLVQKTGDVIEFELLVSADATHQRGEYIRTGLAWPLFARNLEAACQSQLFKKIRVVVTLSVLNLTALPDLVMHCGTLAQSFPRQAIELVPNLVNGQEHLDAWIGDHSWSQAIQDAISMLKTSQTSALFSTVQFQETLTQLKHRLIQAHQGPDPSLTHRRKKFLEIMDHYDQLRGTSLYQAFPESISVFEKWRALSH